MATGKYGLESIGGLDINNYVTPQQGIEDKSLAQGVAALGNVAEQGFNLYKAKEGKDFRQEARGEVLAEAEVFGKAAGVQPNEIENADVKELNDSVERLAQAAALGGPSIKQRAYFRVKSMVLDKIDKNPMLADVYREVGDRVLGDYSTMLDIYASIQSKAEELAGKDPDEKLRAHVTSLSSQSTLALTKSPSTMTRQELQDTELELIANINRNRVLQQERDQTRTDVSVAGLELRGAEYQLRVAELNRGDREREQVQQDIAYGGGVAGEIYAKTNTPYRHLISTISSLAPNDVKGYEVAQNLARQKIQELTAYRDELIYNQGHRWKDDTNRTQTIAETDSIIKRLERLVSGDLSQAKRLADLNGRIQGVYKYDALNLYEDVYRATEVYKEIPQPIVDRVMFRDPVVAEQAPSFFAGPLQDIFRRRTLANDTMDVHSGEKSPSDLPADRRRAVAVTSLDMLAGASKEGTPESIIAREQPEVWGNMVLSVVGDGIDQQDTWKLTSKVFGSNFDQRFSTFSQSQPDKAMHIAGTIIDSAPQMANTLKLTAQTIPSSAGNIQWDANRQMWTLSGPNGMPTLESVGKAKAVVANMNNHLFALESLSAVDSTYETEGKPRGLSPRQYYAATVYGLDPSQMGLVAKESAGEQK